MKKLFYATKNKFKIQNMEDRIKSLNIILLTPYTENIQIDVIENGNTVIENAVIKAKAYYEKVKIPTIAGDSSLFVKNFKEQPGLFVRRVNGIYLNDDELEEYYINKLNEIGGKSEAFYITGLAMINKEHIKTIEIKEEKFILTSDISKSARKNDALGRLEFDLKTNKYFCELTKKDKELRDNYFDKKCLDFIIENI